ncbi:hypothetical protein EB118_12540 [bacterium]|nr:hypothetical protein [bacterium]NDD83510.1 hypothetical protein [bacterium]NDG30887.1 hypothetical protein [bacterium]
MHIVLKKVENTITVCNVFYGHNLSVVQNWVNDYLVEYSNGLKTTPVQKYEKEVEYYVTDNCVYKRYKTLNKGYVYNNYTTHKDNLLSLTILPFDGHIDFVPENNSLLSNINEEINNRVLKQLDKESLLQILQKVNKLTKSKAKFTSTEYTGIIMEVIRDFKKELYSSIAKKLKRFGKKPQALDLSKILLNCKLEAKSKCE